MTTHALLLVSALLTQFDPGDPGGGKLPDDPPPGGGGGGATIPTIDLGFTSLDLTQQIAVVVLSFILAAISVFFALFAVHYGNRLIQSFLNERAIRHYRSRL